MTSKIANNPLPGAWPSLPAPNFGPRLEMNDTADAVPPPYSDQDRIWDVARQTLPEKIPERPRMIAVMGPTGTGKSTFISKLAGQEMKIGHNLTSCKKHSKHHRKRLRLMMTGQAPRRSRKYRVKSAIST